LSVVCQIALCITLSFLRRAEESYLYICPVRLLHRGSKPKKKNQILSGDCSVQESVSSYILLNTSKIKTTWKMYSMVRIQVTS
jgi:hypothetical protein